MSEQEGKGPSEEQVRVASTEHDELRMIRQHFDTHGKSLLIVIAVVIVAALGFSFFKGRKEAASAEAAAMLSKTKGVPDLDNLVSHYPSAPVVPLALLKLAKAHFDAGSYDLAISKYDEFSQKHPQHPFVLAAALGKLHCQEAQGLTEQALAGFAAFVTDHPKHFLVTEAVFGKGRCLEALGRTQEAKVLYEDLLAQDREGPWASRAEEQIAILRRKLGENPQEVPEAKLIVNQPAGDDDPAAPPPAEL
jgi:TolA-binding protein